MKNYSNKLIIRGIFVIMTLTICSCESSYKTSEDSTSDSSAVFNEEQARIDAEKQEKEEQARKEAEERERLEALKKYDGNYTWDGVYQGYSISFKFTVRDGETSYAIWETGGSSSRMDGEIKNGVFYGKIPNVELVCRVSINLATGEGDLNWFSLGEENIKFMRRNY